MKQRRNKISGRYTVWELNGGLWVPLFTRANLRMDTWGYAAAMSLGRGDVSFRVNRMYVEFENVGDPEDVVTVPEFAASDDRTYYDELADPQDYLRIKTEGLPEILVADGYEGVFGDDEGNVVRFRAVFGEGTGKNGVDFSNASNSKIFGIALVASPNADDATSDVLVARGYFAENEQRVIASGGQLSTTWELAFTEE